MLKFAAHTDSPNHKRIVTVVLSRRGRLFFGWGFSVKAPFPYFGGKSKIAETVWARFGSPRQYIEPFCGSAAVLLSAPAPASLEVIGDANGFIANFWRAVVHQPQEVARWADYPVSHVDLGARHVWLMDQRQRLGVELQDPDWPGDAKVAGWWLWGQCAWIGSGWCEWEKASQVPHVSDAGRGVQAIGKVPHVSNAGRGVQAIGKVPHVSDAGRGIPVQSQKPAIHIVGVQSPVKQPDRGEGFWTSCGRTASRWLGELAERLERVRVVHGSWDRCLNNHFGAESTAVFLDPPYDGFEGLYAADSVAGEVAKWAGEHADLMVALCGHVGDYELPGWQVVEWSRGRLTYSGSKTTDKECIWFSPACIVPDRRQTDIFSRLASGGAK